MLINQIRNVPNTNSLTVEMNQTQSYLRWKEDRDFSTRRISKEQDYKTPDQVIEELNIKEPFKYRNKIPTYAQKLANMARKSKKSSQLRAESTPTQ